MTARLQILSDLHFEFLEADQQNKLLRSLNPSLCDAVVLAGDVAPLAGNGRHSLAYALAMICDRYEGKPVLFLPGNHEFYGSESPAVAMWSLTRIEDALTNLHALGPDRGVISVNGVTIAGATLWFRNHESCGLRGIPDRSFSDFGCIGKLGDWVYEANRRDMDALIGWGNDGVDVLVSHHIPHEGLVHPRWARSQLSRFFCTEVAGKMDRLPGYWIYGHTHDASRHKIDLGTGVCDFIVNPLGYPGEPNRLGKFDPGLVINVEPRGKQ